MKSVTYFFVTNDDVVRDVQEEIQHCHHGDREYRSDGHRTLWVFYFLCDLYDVMPTRKGIETSVEGEGNS